MGLALLLVAPVLLSACGDSEDQGLADCDPKFTFPTISQGTLTVASPPEAPYFEGDGKGFEAEFMTKFAKDACLKAKFLPVGSSAAVQTVVTKRADVVIGGWNSTEERGKIVGQTDPSHVSPPAIISEAGWSDLSELEGKKIGTITGYAYAEELKKEFGDGKVNLYQKPDDAMKDLKVGRVDAVVLSVIQGAFLRDSVEDYQVFSVEIMKPDDAVESSKAPPAANYPHTKGNTELTEALNTAIAEDQASGWDVKNLEKYGLPADLVNFG